jgi:Cellulase (glycosyl hydrolase family 5)/Ca-dependent carbohydrate-binding module xylan-binding
MSRPERGQALRRSAASGASLLLALTLLHAPSAQAQGPTLRAADLFDGQMRGLAGGRALILKRNATVTAPITVERASGLVLRARGHRCRGAPRMFVTVSGRRALSVPVRSAYADYQTGLALAPGTHRLQISLVNDLAGHGCDRDLWVDAIRVPPYSERDPLFRRTVAELGVFTDWLARNRVAGYVGEVGWPDDRRGEAARWNSLAERWYEKADAAGLWVTNWAAGEWWGPSYNLASYRSRGPGAGVDTPDTQAAVIEAHPTTAAYRRGVNVAGGAFGAPAIDSTSSFSNANPGRIETDYHYDGSDTFRFLASRQIDLVRIEFRWERLQPRLGHALDRAELARLRAAVAAARAAGLDAILDMHNYGAYYLSDGTQGVRQPLGSRALTIGDFADAWRRISQAFRSNPGVVAYGLMNEPVNMPGWRRSTPARVWERASQAAVDAIRSNGDRRLIMVGGYLWSGVQVWAQQHPSAWIRDPADNIRYEAHHYWDRDHSSLYRSSYAAQVAGLGFVPAEQVLEPAPWTGPLEPLIPFA